MDSRQNETSGQRCNGGEAAKKPIRLSNLAMRFYEHDGWTRDELESCLIKGSLKFWPKDQRPYYILCVGSAFSEEKLKPLVSEVIPSFPEQSTDIDEVIRDYNW